MGKITLSNPGDFFKPGDELAVYDANNNFIEKCWVLEDKSNNGDLYIIDKDGLAVTNTTIGSANRVKIIRSGKPEPFGINLWLNSINS